MRFEVCFASAVVTTSRSCGAVVTTGCFCSIVVGVSGVQLDTSAA